MIGLSGLIGFRETEIPAFAGMESGAYAGMENFCTL